MVSLRRHFVPNPVSIDSTDFAAMCRSVLFLHTRYDGLNRRVRKVVDTLSGQGDNYYYNQNWQMIEDRNGSDYTGTTAIDQYVWSLRYADSPVVCLHDGNANGDVADDYPTDWRR